MGLDLGFGLLPVKGWKESTEKHELWQKKETLLTHSKRKIRKTNMCQGGNLLLFAVLETSQD